MSAVISRHSLKFPEFICLERSQVIRRAELSNKEQPASRVKKRGCCIRFKDDVDFLGHRMHGESSWKQTISLVITREFV